VSTGSNKFVIQKHTSGNNVHWDLMLESGDCLQTWRLDENPNEIVEGPVNEGKGRVRITDAGTYQTIRQGSETIELVLNGQILKGKFTLTHIEEDKWRFSLRG